MKNLNLEKILNHLKDSIFTFWHTNEISHEALSKGDFDVVTQTDLKIEKMLIELLKSIVPNVPILSEESLYDTKQEGTYFSIDPLDGTWNFSHNVPVYGTQVALLENNIPILGIIYLPTFNFMFTAIKDKGAFLNGKQIHTRDFDFNRCMIAVTDLRRNKSIDLLLNLQKIVTFNYGKARMNGCSSYDMAMVSMGAYQGKIAVTPKLWDVAPGIIIVKEAGGSIDFNQDYCIVASSDKMLQSLIKTYKEAKKIEFFSD